MNCDEHHEVYNTESRTRQEPWRIHAHLSRPSDSANDSTSLGRFVAETTSASRCRKSASGHPQTIKSMSHVDIFFSMRRRSFGLISVSHLAAMSSASCSGPISSAGWTGGFIKRGITVMRARQQDNSFAVRVHLDMVLGVSRPADRLLSQTQLPKRADPGPDRPETGATSTT
jgi:hypothetical protein